MPLSAKSRQTKKIFLRICFINIAKLRQSFVSNRAKPYLIIPLVVRRCEVIAHLVVLEARHAVPGVNCNCGNVDIPSHVHNAVASDAAVGQSQVGLHTTSAAWYVKRVGEFRGSYRFDAVKCQIS